jgi:hypothetical protein
MQKGRCEISECRGERGPLASHPIDLATIQAQIDARDPSRKTLAKHVAPIFASNEVPGQILARDFSALRQ